MQYNVQLCVVMEEESRRYLLISRNKDIYKYQVGEKFEAGIVLAGSEVKSIRLKRVSLRGAYCLFKGTELFVTGMRIDHYDHGDFVKPDPVRKRKLLLRRSELIRLRKKVDERGFTIVPVKIYLSGPYVKLEIALVTGKTGRDRRQDIRRRDTERDIRRQMKHKA